MAVGLMSFERPKSAITTSNESLDLSRRFSGYAVTLDIRINPNVKAYLDVSMHDISRVKVANGIHECPHNVGRILFIKRSSLANPIKELSTST